MKSNIAVVTLYDNINIGNKLQNYAVEQLCFRYSKSVETLTYEEAYDIAPDMSWKGRIIAKLGFPQRKAMQKRAVLNRRKKFIEFANNHLHPSQEISFLSLPKDLAEKYDAFVVGSDQVWHNWTDTEAELNYFFLEFAPIEKRICVSPSFGLKSIPHKYVQQYRQGLTGFRYLSCREKDGCDMIHELTGRKADLILDPTFMFNSSEWSRIEKKPCVDIPEKYVLAYFLGGIDEEIRRQVNHLAIKNDMEAVFVFDLQNLKYFDISPDEFLYLIRNAAMICTNSFHGCVFSIIYNKRFAVFDRTDSEGTQMTSRLSTLLDTFGIRRDMQKGQLISPENYQSTAEMVLKAERNHMKRYLDQCFGIEIHSDEKCYVTKG